MIMHIIKELNGFLINLKLVSKKGLKNLKYNYILSLEKQSLTGITLNRKKWKKNLLKTY